MFLKINILSRKKLLITFRNWVLSILTKACYKRHATYRTLSLTLVRFRIQTEIQSMGVLVLSDWNLSYRHLGKVIMGRFVYLFDLQCCTLPVSGILCYSNCADASVWLWAEILLDRNTDYWLNGLSLIAGVSRTKYCQILYLLMYWFRIAKSLYHIIIWQV